MLERIQELLVKVDRATAAGVILETTSGRFKDFLKNMRTQTTTGRSLSPGQNKYLVDIENTCSDETIREADEWSANYNDELREVAVVCAEFYETSPEGSSYFKRERAKVLSNPDGHVLSKREFARMCMNKYADKVINEMKTEPRFSVGQIVEVRTTNRLDMTPYYDKQKARSAYELFRKAMRGERVMALVTKVNAMPMYRAVAGGKVYSIVPLGSMNSYYACEKDLKKSRKVK